MPPPDKLPEATGVLTAAPIAPTEGGGSSEAAAKGILQKVGEAQSAHVELAETIAPKPAVVQKDTDTDTDVDVDVDVDAETTPPSTGSTTTQEKPKTGWAGFFSSLSAGWSGISKWFGDVGGKFGDWIKDLMGIKKGGEGVDPDEDEDADADADNDTDTDFDLDIDVGPGEKISDAVSSSWIKVKSWDEVKAISDLGERARQAALFACKTGMDVFTKSKEGTLENHCSGWCDSVFQMAGLGTVYNHKSHIYSNYLEWPKKGTLQGLKLQPGDSLIRYNANTATGNHQEIVLSSEGPDLAGNYKVVTAGQTSAQGDSGIRQIRSLLIKSNDIKVVIRPGATKPWNGDGLV